MTKYQEILKELKEGRCNYGNHNTSFYLPKEGGMVMYEWTKDGKITTFSALEKFARRINRFYKIGY